MAASLFARWDGAVVHLVEEAGWDGPRVVKLLASTVPGFEDQVSVGGHRLRFREARPSGGGDHGLAVFPPLVGLDSFPVYPDYMLPRFLRHLGILRYSPRLAEEIDSRTKIPATQKKKQPFAGRRFAPVISWSKPLPVQVSR